jgi:MFS family permease
MDKNLSWFKRIEGERITMEAQLVGQEKSCQFGILELIRQRNIGALAIGQLFSLSGDQFYQIALIWLTYKMTNNSLMMGLVAMSSAIPVLLFSLISGALADNINKKRIMIIADSIRALAVIIIPISYYTGIITVPLLIVIAFIMGTMSQFFNPAYHSIIPDITNKENLIKTNSLISAIEQFTGVVAPSLVAILLLFTSEVNLLIVTCSTYVISVVMLNLLKGIKNPEKNMTGNLFGYIKSAFIYLKGNELIVTLILFGAVINLFLSGVLTVISPLYADKILNTGKSGYGILVSFITGGMFLGTLGINFLHKINKGRLFIIGFFGTGISFLFIGLSSISFISYPLFIVFGFFRMLVNITFTVLLQEKVDNDKLGVVISFVILVSAGLSPISSAISGYLAQYVALPYFYECCGMVLMLVSFLAYRQRVIRNA